MNDSALKNLKRRIILTFIASFAVIAVLLFAPAGTLYYWQAWAFIAVIFAPALFVTVYFLKRSPEFLERRLDYKEKEITQKRIMGIGTVVFFLGFVVAGLDIRFGWSDVPALVAIASDAVILASYYIVFLTFKENPFAARTVEVFEGQKVIDTGPYAVVRHPMYAGAIPMYFFIPLALGSYWALLAFVPALAIIILRLLDEEKVLKRGLPGYEEYCQKVRYRLLPGVW